MVNIFFSHTCEGLWKLWGTERHAHLALKTFHNSLIFSIELYLYSHKQSEIRRYKKSFEITNFRLKLVSSRNTTSPILPNTLHDLDLTFPENCLGIPEWLNNSPLAVWFMLEGTWYKAIQPCAKPRPIVALPLADGVVGWAVNDRSTLGLARVELGY